MKRLASLICAFAFSFNFSLSAQNLVSPALAAQLQTKLDSIITHYNVPGISVSVLLSGDRYWNGVAGLSHIYNMTPMDTSLMFQMASVNKMYTAAMIFQLKEQGLLTLDDSVGMYLPSIPNIPSSTTIRNLLTHRSGIYDLAGNPSISGPWLTNPDSIWPHLLTLQTFVTIPPSFTQGNSFSYSSTNFILLGMIIEQITGNTFASELHNRFCVPYGLTQTFFAPDDSIAGPQTTGWTSFTTVGVYDTDASLILNNCSASMFFTAGSIIAKPADVARFTRLLWSGQIISDSSLNIMKQCTSVSFGDGSNGYGYGTMRYSFGGRTYYGHGGDVNGFTQLSIHQQTDSITITISINRNNANRRLIATELLAVIAQSLVTGVQEQDTPSFGISVYPNPAHDKFYLDVRGDEKNQFIFSLSDIRGRMIHNKTICDGRGDTQYPVDISDLEPGMYFIQLSSGVQSITKKIIVE